VRRLVLDLGTSLGEEEAVVPITLATAHRAPAHRVASRWSPTAPPLAAQSYSSVACVHAGEVLGSKSFCNGALLT
jgi:hypothetical protein